MKVCLPESGPQYPHVFQTPPGCVCETGGTGEQPPPEPIYKRVCLCDDGAIGNIGYVEWESLDNGRTWTETGTVYADDCSATTYTPVGALVDCCSLGEPGCPSFAEQTVAVPPQTLTPPTWGDLGAREVLIYNRSCSDLTFTWTDTAGGFGVTTVPANGSYHHALAEDTFYATAEVALGPTLAMFPPEPTDIIINWHS